MAALLQIDSSPFGDKSISRRLTREYAEQWLQVNPNGRVTHRDLMTIRLPVVTSSWVDAVYTPAESRTKEQDGLLQVTAELGRDLVEADEFVIGIPVHNWGPCAAFKLWVDQVVTPFGPDLKGKRATLFVTAGRAYGPASGNETKQHVQPWLRTLFGGLGVEDLRLVFVDGTVATQYGPVGRTEFLAPHVETIKRLCRETIS